MVGQRCKEAREILRRMLHNLFLKSPVSTVQCCCHSSLLPYVLSLAPALQLFPSCHIALVVASSQRPTVLNWQQFLEPSQDSHAFLLPCYSSTQQLHGHLYIICYTGCIDQCCRALPVHTSITNECTCHYICRPQLNMQECQCRLCSSRICPLSVMYVHTD